MAPVTPGKRVPSHGTDLYGQRYALDLVQVDFSKKSLTFYSTSTFYYLFLGVPLNKCHGWGRTIHAPFDGEVIRAEDGFKERRRVHLISDLLAALKNSLFFNPKKKSVQVIAGNYVVMRYSDNIHAVFAHMQNGSVSVSAGQKVKKGDVLGKVGHSGNSTAPHLHFQLMEGSEFQPSAVGVPCAFEQYELFLDGEWKTVNGHIPTHKDRIRSEQ